jgi:hypothetical protein
MGIQEELTDEPTGKKQGNNFLKYFFFTSLCLFNFQSFLAYFILGKSLLSKLCLYVCQRLLALVGWYSDVSNYAHFFIYIENVQLKVTKSNVLSVDLVTFACLFKTKTNKGKLTCFLS